MIKELARTNIKNGRSLTNKQLKNFLNQSDIKITNDNNPKVANIKFSGANYTKYKDNQLSTTNRSTNIKDSRQLGGTTNIMSYSYVESQNKPMTSNQNKTKDNSTFNDKTLYDRTLDTTIGAKNAKVLPNSKENLTNYVRYSQDIGSSKSLNRNRSNKSFTSVSKKPFRPISINKRNSKVNKILDNSMTFEQVKEKTNRSFVENGK